MKRVTTPAWKNTDISGVNHAAGFLILPFDLIHRSRPGSNRSWCEKEVSIIRACARSAVMDSEIIEGGMI
ncbi:MAG: hypothetical protein AVO39_08005 [delta proteobacterium MLS_D]|nr:MAG: hypothetical protein AVO39_08005 [delta proteobacterium MLS_D]